MTSSKSAEEFYNKVPATDKKLSLFEVCLVLLISLLQITVSQGGYHELVHEPDGMADRWVNESIEWIEAHVPAKSPESKL